MNYKVYNDYELIYMVREKDDSSSDILFAKYSPVIRSIASDYYSKFSHYGYDYDDFLQEGYISFQKALRSYDENKGCLFYTFAVMCIKRGLLSFCQRISCKKKNLKSYEIIDIDDCTIVDNSADINEKMLYSEFQQNLKRLLYDLPFEISLVLELRINNFTYLEISSLLDIPISTVNFRCKKVRDSVRQLFNNYYSEKTI